MSATTMPDWLVAQMHADGTIGPGGSTRRARAVRCRRCGAVVLLGDDDDIVARACVVDPAPLSPAGELAALLAGRYTRELHHRRRLELHKRDEHRIRIRRAGEVANRFDVVAEHVCGSSLALEHTSSRLPVAADHVGQEPPF